MAKIKMTTPLVEIDGDEMTRILWHQIKEELLEPFIDLDFFVSMFFHTHPQLPTVFNVFKSKTAILCDGITLPLM